MNHLIRTEFFVLMNENSQLATDPRMKNAYENFMKEVLTLNQSETDFSEVFRSLNFTRIELQALQTQILYGQGEKCA